MSDYKTALAMPTVDDAIAHLWQTQPKDMCHSGHNIEANLRKRFKPTLEQKRYFGPFAKHFYPIDFDPSTHALLLTGPPGVGKTQFARYFLGDCDYIKGTLEGLRCLDFDKPVLFDEISMLAADPEQSKEITDVENGGTIAMRYKDVSIPPSVPRVFCHNVSHPFRNPNEAVYGRRVHHHVIGQVPEDGL